MATITPVIVPCWGFTNLDGYQVTWANMRNGDVGAAIGSTIGVGAAALVAPGGGFMSGFADKTVQAVGVFGPGNIAVEGSNDAGANWFALTNPQGNTIAMTTPSMQEITEIALWCRPHVTTGDGTTNVTVTMFLRKTQQP